MEVYAQLDLRSPIGIPDGPVLRKLAGAGRADGLKERAAGLFHAHQKVGAVDSLVEHPAFVLAEVVVAPSLENLVAFEQAKRRGQLRHSGPRQWSTA